MSESRQPSLRDLFVAEAIGTFILIFFGLGAVHAAVAFGAQSGLWQVATVWGVAIMLAIYCIGQISGAHINPAITLCMYIWDDFEPRKIGPYIAGQLVGAFIAAAMLFLLFSARLESVEKDFAVQRGEPGSEITASCYGEFFPNPGNLAEKPYSPEEHEALRGHVTHATAFWAELFGTAILAFVVMALGNEKNRESPKSNLTPVFIGLTVTLLISVIAPLTQACFNPARDFAPRVFSAFAGWGRIALPLGSDWGWLTVYILAPIIGAILGGGFYKKVVEPIFLNMPAEA